MRIRPPALLLAIGLLAAVEEAPLPATVAKEMDAHAARMAKIDQDAEKARADERVRITKLLDDSIKAETKKGNLEGALRIRQLRDGLQAKSAVSGDDLLGDEAPPPEQTLVQSQPAVLAGAALAHAQKAVIGVWAFGTGAVWTVKPDGTFIRARPGGRGESPGTWRVTDGRIIFVYASGRELPVARVDARQLVVLRDGVESIGERQSP